MQLLDLITIFIFALGIVIMGLSFSGKGRNMKSFFAAGGAVPWAMSGLSIFMGFLLIKKNYGSSLNTSSHSLINLNKLSSIFQTSLFAPLPNDG